jgi:predicted transcriptional regulator
MSKDAENLVQYMPKQFRALHEGILSEITRRPDQQKVVSAPSTKPERADPDLSIYLTRIERASRILESQAARVRELEDTVYDLKRQQVTVEAQLNEANQRCVEVEQELAAEKNRTIRAEALALAADNRAKEQGEAASVAKSKFEALTLAIEEAFKGMAEAPPLRDAA